MASTNKTTNYQLNQWVASDPVLMADFNADNTKLDAAIAAAAQAAAAAQTAANAAAAAAQAAQTTADSRCRIAHGSYVGTGTYGEANKKQISFDFDPKLVILTSNEADFLVVFGIEMLTATSGSYFLPGESTYRVHYARYSNRTLSWWSDNSSGGVNYQMNQNNKPYYWVALG